MANVTSGNPIKIDTATANWAALSLPNNFALDIRRIFWESPTSVGDTIQFTNADGLILFEATAEAAAGNPGNNLIFYFQPREQVWTKNQGWFPKTITSGKVWIDFVYA